MRRLVPFLAAIPIAALGAAALVYEHNRRTGLPIDIIGLGMLLVAMVWCMFCWKTG